MSAAEPGVGWGGDRGSQVKRGKQNPALQNRALRDRLAKASKARHAGAASDAPGAPGVSPAAHAQPGLCLVVAV